MGPLSLAGAWSLSKRSAKAWVDDSAPSMGAALAFYTLFSLAPVLLLALSIAGFFMDRNDAQNALVAQLTAMVGAKAALGIEGLLDAAGTRDDGRLPGIIGLVTLAAGATTVFAELRSDLDRIWRVRAPKASGTWDFVRARLLSFGLVVSIGFLLMVSLVASAAVSALGDRWFAGSAALVRGGEFAASFVLITALFATIFKLLPTPRIAWGDVWIGAAVTSLLFWAGKFLIGLYIGKAAVGSTFGAAGTLVVVVVWVYYSAQIFFLGAEFTREYALHHGSKRNESYNLDRRRASVIAQAANEDHLVDRAREIVKGKDPVLVVEK
ncbi:MAG: YihY/virulence factor BrkB family protein [Usitatibacter sp.]